MATENPDYKLPPPTEDPWRTWHHTWVGWRVLIIVVIIVAIAALTIAILALLKKRSEQKKKGGCGSCGSVDPCGCAVVCDDNCTLSARIDALAATVPVQASAKVDLVYTIGANTFSKTSPEYKGGLAIPQLIINRIGNSVSGVFNGSTFVFTANQGTPVATMAAAIPASFLPVGGAPESLNITAQFFMPASGSGQVAFDLSTGNITLNAPGGASYGSGLPSSGFTQFPTIPFSYEIIPVPG